MYIFVTLICLAGIYKRQKGNRSSKKATNRFQKYLVAQWFVFILFFQFSILSFSTTIHYSLLILPLQIWNEGD